jgi:uncharacterized protein YbjT (DUF2867 family)
MGKTALLIGATGLVGGHVLNELLADNDYSSVTVLTRKTLNIHHPKLKEVLVDFDQIEKYAADIKADTIFCCLGTTIGKAGSQDAFKKVDYEYPLRVGEIAKQNGAQTYLLISALGSSKSSIIFYNRVKAETEEAIKNLQFNSLHILQPSLILGDREEKRIGEGIARAAAPVIDLMMVGPLNKYKSIKAEQIAKAMVYYSKLNDTGVFRHESNELQKVR